MSVRRLLHGGCTIKYVCKNIPGFHLTSCSEIFLKLNILISEIDPNVIATALNFMTTGEEKSFFTGSYNFSSEAIKVNEESKCENLRLSKISI